MGGLPHAVVQADDILQSGEQGFKEEVRHASYSFLTSPPPNVTPPSYAGGHCTSSHSYTHTDPSAIAAVTKGK